MTIVASGTITMGNLNTEMGYSATATISLNDAAMRTLSGTGSGTAVSLSTFYGKSNRKSISVTIATNSTNYTLTASSLGGYIVGKSDITLTINSGITVSATTTGVYALTWTGFTAGDTLTFKNNGSVFGHGGAGGNGSYANSGTPGGAGGGAINSGYAATITSSAGYIAGGGGGGGGGSGTPNSGGANYLGNGGGGGAGLGAGGAGGGVSGGGTASYGGTPGGAGGPFNIGSGGGAGGSAGPGGQYPGGGWGSAGGGSASANSGAGGGGGKAINLNGTVVAWVGGLPGTIYGGVS